MDLFFKFFSVISFHQGVLSGVIAWLIIIIFACSIFSLCEGANKLFLALQYVNRKIKKMATERNWAKNETNYQQLIKLFNSGKGTLFEHPWNEFSESIVLECVDSDEESEVYEYINTEPAGEYFNFQTIVAQFDGWWGRRSVSFFESVPTVLTGLGILGTFIGIIEALPETSTNLEAQIPAFLGGMKNAFITSIMGLSSGILFTALERLVFSRLEQKVTILACSLDHAFRLKTQQDFLGKIEDYSRKQYDATRKLAMEIGQEIVKGITDGGINTVEISDTVKAGLSAGFEKLTVVLEGLSKTHDDFIQSATDLNEKYRTISLSVSNLNKSSEICSNSFEISSKGFKDSANELNSANQALIASAVETTKTITEQKLANQALIASAAETTKTITEQKLANESLSTASEATQENLTQLSQMSSNFLKQYESVFNDFENKVNTFNESNIKTLEGNLNLFDKELAGGMNQWRDNIVSLKSLLEDLRPTVEELHETFQTFNKLTKSVERPKQDE